MILEALYGNIIKSAEFFLNLLPNVDTSFMEQWKYIKSVLLNIFTGLGCLIPFGSLFPLLWATLSLWAFRLILAIILRIKSFIPFIGG